MPTCSFGAIQCVNSRFSPKAAMIQAPLPHSLNANVAQQRRPTDVSTTKFM